MVKIKAITAAVQKCVKVDKDGRADLCGIGRPAHQHAGRAFHRSGLGLVVMEEPYVELLVCRRM